MPLLGTEIGPLNPLQLACLMECGECALAVLGYCSAEEMRRRSISGNTALHYASFSGLELVVTGLLRMVRHRAHATGRTMLIPSSAVVLAGHGELHEK